MAGWTALWRDMFLGSLAGRACIGLAAFMTISGSFRSVLAGEPLFILFVLALNVIWLAGVVALFTTGVWLIAPSAGAFNGQLVVKGRRGSGVVSLCDVRRVASFWLVPFGCLHVSAHDSDPPMFTSEVVPDQVLLMVLAYRGWRKWRKSLERICEINEFLMSSESS